MAQLKLTIDCLNKICRTCLSTENKLKSFSKNEDLVTMLSQLTPIKLDLNDILPKQMCVVCISKLNIVHNFIQTSTRAESDLKQAIENDKQTLMPHLQSMPATNDTNDINDSNSENENCESDKNSDDSESFAFSLPDDDLFECEENHLKEEKLDPDDDLSQIIIAHVESVPDETIQVECCENENQEIINSENDTSNSSFRGFNHEEIQITQNNLEKYMESVQQSESNPKRFFDSIKYKCYLCENKLNWKCDKPDIKILEFSTLNDDAHVLCKKRVTVLQEIIKELYLKLDELSSLNNSWQKVFLQGAEKRNERRVAELPVNPVNEIPTKPHEIGYRKDGQVHLGHLTWIPETDFDRAFRFSLNPSKFLINMSLTLFGVETLAKSTITGISKNGIKKEPLNSIRMCALKSSLKYYMKEYNVPDYYQKHIWKNFNKILGQKISIITAEYKKRCLGIKVAENTLKKGKK